MTTPDIDRAALIAANDAASWADSAAADAECAFVDACDVRTRAAYAIEEDRAIAAAAAVKAASDAAAAAADDAAAAATAAARAARAADRGCARTARAFADAARAFADAADAAATDAGVAVRAVVCAVSGVRQFDGTFTF